MITVRPDAFRLDLSSETIFDAVAKALKAEIPGLTTYIQSDVPAYATVLHARYACPCGEVSGLSLELPEEPDPRRIPFLVDMIKHRLREHVRAEGNEPNF